MIPLAPRRLQRSSAAAHLGQTLQAETIDDFVRGCAALLKVALPFHSLCVSFSRLEYVCPWLIRDTLPIPADLAYVNERYHALNPSLPFLRQNIGIRQSLLADQLDCMPTAARESYQQRFRRREGWDKYAEIHFWDHRTLQAQICVRRDVNLPDFSGRDLGFLAELRELLAGAVGRLHRQHRDRATAGCLQHVLSGLPLPLLVLNWNLEPALFSAPARHLCAEWLLGPEAARTYKLGRFADIPPEILAACEAKKAALVLNGFAAQRPDAATVPGGRIVTHPTCPQLRAQVEVIAVSRELIEMPHFLVRFQSEPAAGPDPAFSPNQGESALAALACLTPAEREIALLAAEGHTNRQIGRRLSRAVPTIKMHLRSVFKKLAVTNRTRLARLLAPRPI